MLSEYKYFTYFTIVYLIICQSATKHATYLKFWDMFLKFPHLHFQSRPTVANTLFSTGFKMNILDINIYSEIFIFGHEEVVSIGYFCLFGACFNRHFYNQLVFFLPYVLFSLFIHFIFLMFLCPSFQIYFCLSRINHHPIFAIGIVKSWLKGF